MNVLLRENDGDNNVDMDENGQESELKHLPAKILKEIENNLWGCDFILCLFFAALNSFRVDKCLRPFPHLFMDKYGKNFGLLRKTCQTIPPLKKFLQESTNYPIEIVNLLEWLFFKQKHPILHHIQNYDCTKFPSKISDSFKPNYLFEVCPNEKSEELWRKRVNGKEIILAYHGSKIENFYSILKVGLQQHFSYDKEVLYGTGIYLSTELSISAHYSHFGQTWKNSALGRKHSVIAICEIINDGDKVKYKDSRKKRGSASSNGNDDIPENYFIVTDSDMVRVKYLMVYKENSGISMQSFIIRHAFLISMIFYSLVIVFIGFYSKSNFITF